MNILIIGSGYLGKAVSKMLRKKGYHVEGTTRYPEKVPLLRPFFDQIIVWNPASYKAAFVNKDIVIFCAAADSPDQYQEAYFENAKRVLAAAPTIGQIIYTSSTSVYGELDGRDAHEDLPIYPTSPEQDILLKTENLLLKNPHTCIFRLGEIIGPGRTIERRIRKMGENPFPGDGLQLTNLSPLTDVLNGIDFAIENQLSGLYNLTSDLHIARKELYEKIRETKKLNPIHWDPALKSRHAGSKKVLNGKLKKEGFVFEALPWEGILEELPQI